MKNNIIKTNKMVKNTVALSALAIAIKKQVSKEQTEKYESLARIAALTDYETAEAAEDICGADLYKLDELERTLAAGVPKETAIEAVSCGMCSDKIIAQYRYQERVDRWQSGMLQDSDRE